MIKFDSNIITKSRQQWINQGRNQKKQFVFYQGLCLDLGYFKNKHPGGSQVIRNYLYKDVTDILFTVFPHNKQRVNKILQNFVVGKLDQPTVQRPKLQGTILKWGRYLKQNSDMKKSVKFASQIPKLPSEKQKKKSRSKSKSKSKKKKQGDNKNPKSLKILTQGKPEINSKKSLDPNYVNSLKPKQKTTKTQNEINSSKVQKQQIDAISQGQLLQQSRIDSEDSELGDGISQSTKVSISIKNMLPDKVNEASSGLIQEEVQLQDCCIFPEQEHHSSIRVPVLAVKNTNRIW